MQDSKCEIIDVDQNHKLKKHLTPVYLLVCMGALNYQVLLFTIYIEIELGDKGNESNTCDNQDTPDEEEVKPGAGTPPCQILINYQLKPTQHNPIE